MSAVLQLIVNILMKGRRHQSYEYDWHAYFSEIILQYLPPSSSIALPSLPSVTLTFIEQPSINQISKRRQATVPTANAPCQVLHDRRLFSPELTTSMNWVRNGLLTRPNDLRQTHSHRTHFNYILHSNPDSCNYTPALTLPEVCPYPRRRASMDNSKGKRNFNFTLRVLLRILIRTWNGGCGGDEGVAKK